MYYYKIEGQLCCSLDGSLPYEKTEAPKEVTSLVYLLTGSREAAAHRLRSMIPPCCLLKKRILHGFAA